MSLALLETEPQDSEAQLRLEDSPHSSPGPSQRDWPTLNEMPSSSDDEHDKTDDDLAASLGDELPDTESFALGDYEFHGACPACDMNLNAQKAPRPFGAKCHRSSANKMLDSDSCSDADRKYLLNSLTFPENSRSPVKKSAGEITLELLDNKPANPFQKGVYPEGYRVLDLDFWARFENGLESEPNEPCVCGLCHDCYNGSHCVREYTHHFRSHSAPGRRKHKEARTKAERASCNHLHLSWQRGHAFPRLSRSLQRADQSSPLWRS